MSIEAVSAQVAQELANRDLADIRALLEVPGWDRYLMRRLKQKREEWHEKLLNEDGLSAEQREVARCIVKEYDVIFTMLKHDEFGARGLLGH